MSAGLAFSRQLWQLPRMCARPRVSSALRQNCMVVGLRTGEAGSSLPRTASARMTS